MNGICLWLGVIIVIIVAIILYCCFSSNPFNSPFNNPYSFNKNFFTNNNTSEDVKLMNKYLGMDKNPGIIPTQITNPSHIELANKISALQGKPINKTIYNKLTSQSKPDISSIKTAISSPVAAGIRNVTAATKAATQASAATAAVEKSMSIPMEKIAAAEQELWMANRLSAGQVSLDNLNYAKLDIFADTIIDYDAYLDNMVIDERLSSNHSNWVNEMLPWSGTAQTVDNIDEALTNSLPFVGFSRPQAVAQDPSALFKTEIDASNLIGNYNPFNVKK